VAVIVDIHTHILPGVDDGAENFDEAVEMLRIAEENGTTDIVLTPHHLTRDLRGLKITKDDILSRFETFKQSVSGMFPKLNLYVGAETYAGSNLYDAIENDQILTINNTRYVLIEFGFNDHARRAYNTMMALVDKGYVPIIAHPERYAFVKDDPMSIVGFLDSGALLQLNVGSLAGENGGASQEIAMMYLDDELASIVASDGHSVFQRNPDMSEAHAFVSSVFSSAYADDLFYHNPMSVLKDKRI
jgi:protein-tyrosine phosphatase